jgi:methyl-accepting chemotaxis protein
MLASMKVRSRLALGFGVVILLLAASAASGYWGVALVSDKTLDALAHDARMAQAAARTEAGVLQLRRFEKDFFINLASPAESAAYLTKWRDHNDALQVEIRELEAVVSTSEQRSTVSAIKEALARYDAGFQKVQGLMSAGAIVTTQAANQAITEYKRDIHALEAMAEALTKDGDVHMASLAPLVTDVRGRAVVFVVTFSVLALLASIAITLALARSILSQLGAEPDELSRVLERLAAGDLTVKLAGTAQRRGMAASTITLVDRLAAVITEVRNAASGLATGATQVSTTSQTLSSSAQTLASSAQTLSHGTAEQATSVEETTTSLNQMTASIEANAEHSRETEQMATEGAAEAEESGKAVQAAVVAMSEIAERVALVEEIAYQTNLLALNASIEAARAGEHGRGFAVVATEVRKLAERSQKAVREIRSVASSSVTVAQRSGALLATLVPRIKKTAELVREVSAASHEQSLGVTQIGKAMGNVDVVTQRNASAAEETASASEELSSTAEELASTAEEMNSQAGALDEIMSYFQVARGVGREPMAPASRPTAALPLKANIGAALHHGPVPAMARTSLAPPTSGPIGSDRDFRSF